MTNQIENYNGDTHKLLALQLKHQIANNDKNQSINTIDSKGRRGDDVNNGGDNDLNKSLENKSKWDKLNSLSDRHASVDFKNKVMLSTL